MRTSNLIPFPVHQHKNFLVSIHWWNHAKDIDYLYIFCLDLIQFYTM